MAKELIVRIKEKGRKGRDSFEYKNSFILENPVQLALLFEDLDRFGANISKAFRQFKKSKEEEVFPF